MLIFRFLILFQVTTRIGLQHAFVILSVSATVSLRPLPSEYPVSSDWSAHTRLSQHL